MLKNIVTLLDKLAYNQKKHYIYISSLTYLKRQVASKMLILKLQNCFFFYLNLKNQNHEKRKKQN